MSEYVSRRFLLGGIASIAAQSALADAPLSSPRPVARRAAPAPRLIAAAETLVAEARLGGKVGYVVADAHTGQVLETMSPLLPLPPASVAKAVTALYGLDTLGGGHRFQTRLVATGPVNAGQVEGDLVLMGSGDPMLDTDALGIMAKQLKAAGVTGITGKFLVYENAMPYLRAIDDGQPDHLGYNPAISGLNLNFNRVHFEWKRDGAGYAVTMDARAVKFRPEVSIAQMKVVERNYPVYTYSDAQGVDSWTVAQAALGNGGSRWLPVRRPGLYAAEVFQTLARLHGVRLPRAVEIRNRPGGTVLVDHSSASLSTITRLMLKHSTNLTAEIVGLSATSARSGKPQNLAASARAMSAWMKSELGARHAKFLDHSGLNDRSRVSASDMVKALVRVGPDGALYELMKEVKPLNDKGGLDKTARHRIQAKTGSLNFVSSLAGKVTTGDGRPLAFAIFTGDMPRRNKIKRTDRERPEGARGWGRRARRLQHRLITRWADLYGG